MENCGIIGKDANMKANTSLATMPYIRDDDKQSLFNRILADIELGLEKHAEWQTDQHNIAVVNSGKRTARLKRNLWTVSFVIVAIVVLTLLGLTLTTSYEKGKLMMILTHLA